MTSRQILSNFKCFKEKAFVNGRWTAGINHDTFPVFSPASGKEIASVPDFGEVDIQTSIECASNAFASWRHSSCKDRSHMLKRLTSRVLKHEEELATIMTIESGKPIQESRGEVKYAASFLDWYSEEAKRINGDILPNIESNIRRMILKQPVGVCGMITPWNFPLAMITRKVGAAMAAGCTSVLKPSEETPLSALAFAQLVHDEDIPEGVVNVITCSRKHSQLAGTLLCTSPLVHKISFTGSTLVGKWLLEKSATTVKKVSMELGGNAPLIVFDSADVKQAVEKTVKSRFRNTGQTCICAERIFVQEGIYDRFMEELKRVTTALKVDEPLNESCDIGTLINRSAIDKVHHHVNDAIDKGAAVVCGGKQIAEKGDLFYEPTILSDCTTDMLCIKEETFGPVAPVLKFKTEDEALLLSNTLNSGLAGYIFTNDYKQLWRVAEKLEVGMIGVNDNAISNEMIPFGGIKESGLGREGSVYGINDYLELKLVCVGI